jgi:hypothetical protein
LEYSSASLNALFVSGRERKEEITRSLCMQTPIHPPTQSHSIQSRALFLHNNTTQAVCERGVEITFHRIVSGTLLFLRYLLRFVNLSRHGSSIFFKEVAFTFGEPMYLPVGERDRAGLSLSVAPLPKIALQK